MEQHFLNQSIDPSEGLTEVFFNIDLLTYVNKKKDLPAILKQAALERMQDIPMDVVQVLTDGSKNDNNWTGRGIYVRSLKKEVKIQKRNIDFPLFLNVSLLLLMKVLTNFFSPTYEGNLDSYW